MAARSALLIANYDYQDPALDRLLAPANDVEALAAVLRDQRIADFEVATLVNEPHHRVGEAIGEFYRDRHGDDLLLLYFSGHGLRDEDGRLHLAAADTRLDNLFFTAVSADNLDRAMESCSSRRKVLVLDCCYSGAFPRGWVRKGTAEVHALERLQGRGRSVLTASDAAQYSFEGEEIDGKPVRSVFTKHLVAGLRDGSADLDGDGDVTLDERSACRGNTDHCRGGSRSRSATERCHSVPRRATPTRRPVLPPWSHRQPSRRTACQIAPAVLVADRQRGGDDPARLPEARQ
jgi:uncharacterized caspase-like protein